ncbi:MAG: type I restriction enzyme S subunit [Oceanospirillaceae bacterium]|jgi:type I restriction enzyme S subunit
MASNWTSSFLTEIVDIHTGKLSVDEVKLDDYVSTDCMVPDFGGITSAEKMPTSGKVTNFRKGDVLFSNIRTYFKKLWLADKEGACSNDVIVFRPKEGIESNYIFHVLMNERFIEYTVKTSKGTKMPRGDKDAILKYEFPLAPKKQRKLIGNSLIPFKKKIELNQQTNQTIEQIGQVLFKSWFVYFDPVIDNALAVGTSVNDFPEALQHRVEHRKQAQKLADYKPLPDNIQKLFPSEFEQTDETNVGSHGWIPKGWDVKSLSDLLEVKYGKDHKKLNEGLYPVYGSGGLMRNAEKFLYEGESVLIPRKGTLTNLMYVNEKFWTVDTMFYTIPKLENVAKFTFYHLKTLDFTAMNVGSAVPSMTTKVLNALQVITPTTELLHKFDEIIGVNNQKVVSNLSNTKQLEKLRDTLLPKLISGEISIPESKVSMEA